MKILILLILAIFITCSNSPTRTYTPTAKGQVRSGWRYFERENYEKALDKFSKALELDGVYAPAYNGLAWTFLQQDSLNSVIDQYDQISEISVDSMAVLNETAVAALIASSLLDDYSQVINLFEKNTSVWTEFSFIHLSGIDEKLIRKHAALAYYHEKKYEKSASEIKKINPAWSFDENDPLLPSKILTQLNLLFK